MAATAKAAANDTQTAELKTPKNPLDIVSLDFELYRQKVNYGDLRQLRRLQGISALARLLSNSDTLRNLSEEHPEAYVAGPLGPNLTNSLFVALCELADATYDAAAADVDHQQKAGRPRCS